MRPVYEQLNIVGSGTGEGLPFPCGSLRDKTIQVAGVSNSTINIEATCDGTNWVAVVTGATNGVSQLSGTYKMVRVNLTVRGADISGVAITLAGLESRSQ